MTKKRDMKEEKDKFNQTDNKEHSMPIDPYVRLYTQVVREVSENLKQKTSLLKIYVSEEKGTDKISSDKNIHHYFKKLQNSSKI